MTNKSADLQIALEHNEPRFNEFIIEMDDQILDINELLNDVQAHADGNEDLMQVVDDLDVAKNELFHQVQRLADKAMQYGRLAKSTVEATVQERDKAIEELAELENAIDEVDTSHPAVSDLYETVQSYTIESWDEVRYYQAVEDLEHRLMSKQDAHDLAHFLDGVDGLFEEAAHYLPALKRLVLLLEMEAAGEIPGA